METIPVFYCLLCATLAAGGSVNVEGLEGGEVSFQCSHKNAWNSDKYFCKNPCQNSDNILATVKSGGKAESGRITLVDSGYGVFTLTFRQLQLSDSGIYWCGVTRLGFDTYKLVHLTVKEAVANETTAAIPYVSPTWTYQSITNSTQLSTQIDTSPTDLSTPSNFTNGTEQNISTGTILYATFGGIALLTVLVLATRFRKCRELSQPQPVCFHRTAPGSVREKEECGDTVKGVRCVTKLSESTSASTHHPRQDPPTFASTAAEDGVLPRIYENISFSRGTEGLRYSPASDQDNDDDIYIKPLPYELPERTADGSLKKQTYEPATCKNICTNNASPCLCRPCSESTEVRPRSLWFGLDLSGINQGYSQGYDLYDFYEQ